MSVNHVTEYTTCIFTTCRKAKKCNYIRALFKNSAKTPFTCTSIKILVIIIFYAEVE